MPTRQAARVRAPFAGQCRRSVFVEKLVIEDGGRQSKSVLGIVNRVLHPNQPPLAKYIAVLLAGDFFGHLEDQFYKRIRRQLLRAVKQYPRLADVLDHSLVPGTEIFSAVSKRNLRSQAACPGHPGRVPLTGAASHGGGLRRPLLHPASATHGLPVILVSGRAQQADLVVLSTRRPARPGKLVRTVSQHENIHEFLRHDDGLLIRHFHLPTAWPF